jgi:H+-transporting ATPase
MHLWQSVSVACSLRSKKQRSWTCFCTDKTGSITEDRLALAGLLSFASGSEDELLRWAALASEPATQDPIDLAILAAAEARNLFADQLRRVEFIPFDPAQRYSLGRYESATGSLCVVKV